MTRLALVLFPTLLIGQQSLDLVATYWIPQTSGRVRGDAAGLGSDIDVHNDLGLQDTNFPVGNVAWQKGRSCLTFSYTPIDFTADQNVNRTVVFRGNQYTIGTRVVSELEAQHLEL